MPQPNRADILRDVKADIVEACKREERLFANRPSYASMLRRRYLALEAAVRDTPMDDDLREALGFVEELMSAEGMAP